MSGELERAFNVKYQYGTYCGTVRVWAQDSEQAVALAKRELRPHMTLPMAYQSFKAVEA